MRVSAVAAVVVGVLGAEASAQEPLPTVVPFPLEFKRTPAGFSKQEREGLQKLVPMLVRGADAAVPDATRLGSAVAELKRQDCEREDECLAQLAKLAGSLYGLYLSVDYNSDKHVVAVGRVVRDDGLAMGAAQTVDIVKGETAFKELARDAINQLLAKLGVGKLSPFRPVAAKEAGPPPTPPPFVEATTSTPRTVGWILAGTGAAVGLGGGVVLAIGSASQPAANPAGWLASDAEVAAYKQARATQTAGGVLLIAGCAVAAGGLALALLSPAGQSGPRVSVVPLVGGAAVSIQGEF